MHHSWLEVKNLTTPTLRIDHLAIRENETWCILGSNRSGADKLVSLFSGDTIDKTAGVVQIVDDFRAISFSSQQELYEREVRNDDTDYMEKIDPGTRAGTFIGESEDAAELVRLFRLDHVLESGYRQLSSGESRKLLILEAITHGVRHLLIENPYDGLDVDSCRELDRVAQGLQKRGLGLVIFLTSRHDIPGWCTHIAYIKDGSVALQGTRKQVLGAINQNSDTRQWSPVSEIKAAEDAEETELVRLVGGTVGYGERTIFSAFDLLVRQGDHTLITGPNGAGKSTLLAVITGDHPDCYTNELYLFGKKRGSGESIWELKKEMGIVSPALHRSHYVPGSTLQIVISGFFDSIGLYSKFTASQKARAQEWLANIGLEAYAAVPFRRLSFAQQRLALIARALIKLPRLLILDEPTQGLDDQNRESLLNFLEMVAEKEISTILYVSHRRDEYRSFFSQQIDMGT